MNTVLLFTGQFFLVTLLGLQTRFVRDSQYSAAVVSSLGLGVCGLIVTPAIADVDILNSALNLSAYMVAGPLAICLAIYLHDSHTHRTGVRGVSSSQPRKGETMSTAQPEPTLKMERPALPSPAELADHLARFDNRELASRLNVSRLELSLALCFVHGLEEHQLDWRDRLRPEHIFTHGEIQSGVVKLVPDWFLKVINVFGTCLSQRFIDLFVVKAYGLKPYSELIRDLRPTLEKILKTQVVEPQAESEVDHSPNLDYCQPQPAAGLAERVESHKCAIRMAWKTVNEIRALEDLPPVPGGNCRIVSEFICIPRPHFQIRWPEQKEDCIVCGDTSAGTLEDGRPYCVDCATLGVYPTGSENG